ncbi:MAG: metal-dependent transcriptional regulator [Oscillospiraceae bacterium]|jgi:Mn-dependent DtxR family transcriptional regulator|nr:metal-dependent transcriptional regulator [Oscillospiraceae bacterium]
MEIRASAEDYLETILLLSRKAGSVRSIDIVGEMGFSKPSVSIAMKKLRENGMIQMDADSEIHLTEQGVAAATRVMDRHETIYDWLRGNGVSETAAAADACRMEHIISEETYAVIRKLAGGSGGHANDPGDTQ